MKKYTFFAFVCIMFIFSVLIIFYPIRLDMTNNSAWTFSSFTTSKIKNLSETVYIKWYRSRELSSMTPSTRYIEDILKEFNKVSNNHIQFSIEDPVLDNQINTVTQLGIVSRDLTQTENDQEKITSLYSGFLIEYGIHKKVIPFLLEPLEIEYEFIKNIDALLNEQTNSQYNSLQLAIASDYESYYSYLIPYLSYAGYSITRLNLNSLQLNPKIPLLLIGSKNISVENIHAIEAFIEQGGSAAFFTSANNVQIDANWKADALTYNPLLHYLSTQGFNLDSSLLLDISHFRITMPSLDGSKYEYSNYPFWIISLPAFNNKNELITKGLQSLQFYWPGKITVAENSGISPLIFSTPNAITMEPPYDTDPFGKSLSLFHSKKDTIQATLAAYRQTPSRMIVVSDEYMISDIIEYTGSDQNLDFLTTIVEWLSNKDELFPLKYKIFNSGIPERSENESISILHLSRIIYLVIIPMFLIIFWIVFIKLRNKTYEK